MEKKDYLVFLFSTFRCLPRAFIWVATTRERTKKEILHDCSSLLLVYSNGSRVLYYSHFLQTIYRSLQDHLCKAQTIHRHMTERSHVKCGSSSAALFYPPLHHWTLAPSLHPYILPLVTLSSSSYFHSSNSVKDWVETPKWFMENY